jgi:hypothetical protein
MGSNENTTCKDIIYKLIATFSLHQEFTYYLPNLWIEIYFKIVESLQAFKVGIDLKLAKICCA